MSELADTGKLDTRHRIELTEGVEIWLPIAGPFARGLAFMVDLLLRLVVALIVTLLLGMASGYLGENVTQGLILLFAFFWMWFYNVPFELGKRGATPGKRFMGLRVVQLSGAPVTFSQSLVRNFLRFVDGLPLAYGLGLLSCISTRSFQRLGDLAAGTAVIYSKPNQSASGLVPDHLKPLAPTMPLDREEQLAILNFLDRAGSWSDARREEMASQLPALTGGVSGPDAVDRLLRIGLWIRQSS